MTLEYAAPEQLRGDTATAQTDVYALGIIAFELLMSSRPFNGSDLRHQHLQGAVPEMASVSPRLATIVAECLYKDPRTRPTPNDLVRRLKNQTNDASVTGGLHALQRANLALKTRQGEEANRKRAASEELSRRATLWNIALPQIDRIGESLRTVIIDNAPDCRPIEPVGGGWQLRLNEASVALSPAYRAESSVGANLPFDVIAVCQIAVGPATEQPLSENFGRAHSLWFCNAQTEDRYAWFETAFSGSRGRGGQDVYCMSDEWGMLMLGSYTPFATNPSDDVAISALSSLKSDSSGFEVAWPFTPLILGEADEFVNRWATWFADASQGKRSRPSVIPRPELLGSWRKSTDGANAVPSGHVEDEGVHRATPVQLHRDPSLSVISEDGPTTLKGCAAGSRAASGVADEEIRKILRDIDYSADVSDVGSIARGVAVALHLPRPERVEIHRKLCTELAVRPSPALSLKHLSDRGQLSAGTNWLAARLAPLRFLNGTRYQEFVYACGANPRLALVERREPAGGSQRGQLYAAFVVVAAEPSGFPNGSPSPSIRAWLKGQGEMLAPS
jgi:hypothetical protein